MRVQTYLSSLLMILIAACSNPKPTSENSQAVEEKVSEAPKPPKRIILFIGDGMGMNYVSAAAYANGGPLAMMSMPHFGSTTHHEYEHASTDSAASATALATGRKTHFEGVSVTPGTSAENETDDARHMETLMEAAKAEGLGTGLVSTTVITHATPAAFGAHRANRDSADEIAQDFFDNRIDVMIGGGMRHFNERKDGRDLAAEFSEWGYQVADNVQDMRVAQNKPLAAFLTPGHFPLKLTGERPISLKEMTEEAITRLDMLRPKGWVLMVEGSQIDWCGHGLDAACAVSETLDLDEAVGSALNYSRERDDTLVVVTADHETGGLAVITSERAAPFVEKLGGKEKLERAMDLKKGGAPPAVYDVSIPNDKTWTWEEPQTMSLGWGYLSQASRPLWDSEKRFYAAHTITLVGVMAEGPGAEALVQMKDNADLGKTLKSLVAGDAGTARAKETTKPKNVILMVADGLGHSGLAAATYVHGELKLRELPHQGFVSTHGTDRLVNDSAATATALATGKRTRYNAVGMFPENGELKSAKSVLEAAESLGLRTGLVTTTQLSHATPAAFYAHVNKRSQTGDIAKQFLDLKNRVEGTDGIDVALGGGKADFGPHLDALKTLGYSVSETWPVEPQSKLFGVFADQGLDSAEKRLKGESKHPPLAAMTDVALKSLPNEKGFFLVVEGGQLDWRLHEAARDMSVIQEIVDFDQAVEVAKRFVDENPDTLLIVTSDHDHTLSVIDNHYPFTGNRCGAEARCGGTFESIELPVNSKSVRNAEGFVDKQVRGDWADSVIMLQYAWLVQQGKLKGASKSAPHTAHFVPIFAYGPWAYRFEGYLDQPQIGQILLEWAR